jgi:predicted phage-related endonuclease
MEMGRLLEPITAYWYEKKTGYTVSEDTGLYQHADFPYALANFDRRFTEPSGIEGILECKSTTYYKSSNWSDGAIPVHHKFQLRYYLAVADVQVGDFACIWGNNPNSDMATPRIFRDKHKEDIIFEKLDQWIWSLKNDKPPTMADVNPKLALESLARIYEKSKPGLATIEFTKKHEDSLRKIAELQSENADLDKEKKQNEKEIETHSARIAEMMKEHEHGILETTTDKLLIDFVTKTTRRVNSDLLKKNHPTIYDECLKHSHSRKVKVRVEPAVV